MGKMKDLLRNQRRSGVGRGSGSDFYRKVTGKNVFRVFLTEDLETGEMLPFYQYLQHWSANTVCPKTFKEDAYCEICEQAEVYYEAARDLKEELESASTAAARGSLKTERDQTLSEARNYRAKKQSWWCIVPLMPDMEPTYMIFDIPFGATQKILGAMANKAGWSGEPDFGSMEFLDCIEEGLQKCCGSAGYDVIMDFNRQRPAKEMYKISVSVRPGRKLQMKEEPPCMEELFLRIKGINKDGGEKAEEPKPTKKAPTPRKKKAPARKKAAPRKKAPARKKAAPRKKKAPARKKK